MLPLAPKMGHPQLPVEQPRRNFWEAVVKFPATQLDVTGSPKHGVFHKPCYPNNCTAEIMLVNTAQITALYKFVNSVKARQYHSVVESTTMLRAL